MKAYTKEKDGERKYYVEAIASDTGIDYYMERMSENAIRRMAEQVKKGVIILPTHWDTFEIGKTVDGEVLESNPFGEETDTGNDKLYALKVVIELDSRYPEAMSLYEEVERGNPTKQLSVGGWLNPDNDEAVYWEKVEATVKLPNGTETTETYYILVIDDLILDHIAITRAGHAANERTGFLSAISKSLRCELNNKFEVVRTNVDDLRNFKVKKSKAKMIIEKTVDEHKEAEEKISSGDEHVIQIGKSFLELLKSIFNKKDNQKEVEKMHDVEKDVQVTAEHETKTAEIQSDVEKTTDEAKTEETTTAEVEKAKPEIDAEELKSKVVEEVMEKVKSAYSDLANTVIKSIQDTASTTIANAIEEIIKSQIKPLADKIKSIEDNIAGSKAIEGQEEFKTKEEEPENIWKGSFITADVLRVIQAQKAARQAEEE